MNDRKLPPPFVVGEKYFDRSGEYIVIDTDGAHITIEYPDGRRKIEDANLKARIHRGVVMDADVNLASNRVPRRGKRTRMTPRRKRMIEMILELEKDGAHHTGVEIDGLLAGCAADLGYSEEDVTKLNAKTGRSVFGNDGDWAKSEMTVERLHEVVDTTVHWEAGTRRQCNIYRITTLGLEELHKRGAGQKI